MKLDGPMMKRLHDALLDAYGSRSAFARLARFYLPLPLDEIAGSGNLADVVFELLDWAERNNKITELMEGAVAENRDNPMLAAAVAEFRAAHAASSPSVIPVVAECASSSPPVVQTAKSAANVPQIGATKTNPVDGAVMVWIPRGTFQMGSDKYDDEKPVHAVTLSGFWLYQTPVTVAQFLQYDEASEHKYDWIGRKPVGDWQVDHPTARISWEVANAYAKWAGVQLPTEAQWEYAARGGLEGKNYPWGNDWSSSKCANSVGANSLQDTQPVGSYAANGYGLYDMAGNVWEWCADWYSEKYYKTAGAGAPNPTGPASGASRVRRGGSWYCCAEVNFRCADRNSGNPNDLYDGMGFRCCIPG